ncbi:type VI secretion system contractile sheath small subunit [Niabella yanshanensis]|uniref:Type VI secretion system contractile sheath small subunit n=1 Tax=Niabella yanshanensis TaxID=577386 RepID=A0ABZ0W9R9_9BACT|nr:type VI secretion system contractile sheath small subunit [Niabella yanshanensis]WQD40028.1 type VI secretion system contractile sheath small subunit [Niabella yanshanensis]
MSDANGNLGETLNHISANRTLIAKKLTVEEVMKPEVVHGLQTIEQVFNYYQPRLHFRFEDPEGLARSEELRFKTIDDFSCSSITRQSRFLTHQLEKKKIYLKLARQLKTNQPLRDVLTDKNKRKAFETMLKAMMEDLKK